MRAFIIDTKTDEAKGIDIEYSLKTLYKLICCDLVDIVVREINGKEFNIVVDDEGLFKKNRISGFGVLTEEKLVGTMLVFGVGDDRDIRGLTKYEEHIIARRVVQSIFADGSERPVLWYTR